MKQKYYVVWVGRETGIFRTWDECRAHTRGYKGAKYKSFGTEDEAKAAFCNENWLAEHGANTSGVRLSATRTPSVQPQGFCRAGLAVDAACSGNPGPMEYRAVYLADGKQIFHFGPVYGTNNIGEFLAIVHALALLKKQNLEMPVYSDSRNAIMWVRQKKCKTRLERNQRTEQLFQLIERAEKWLHENTYATPVLKWDTKAWGEIPADFGRK